MTEWFDLDQQIESAQDRLQHIKHQAEDDGFQEPLLFHVISELSIALEELQVSSEELHAQNEALLTSRQSLEIERQQYRNLFDFAPEAYLVTDEHGVIQSINRAAEQLLNLNGVFAIHKPLILYIAKSDRPFIYTQLNRINQVTQQLAAQTATQSLPGHQAPLAQATLVFQDQEISLKPRQHPALPTSLSLSVESNPQGQVRLYWLFRDLRERKHIEHQLRMAQMELEHQVQQRTLELTEANAQLRQELAERERFEAERRRFTAEREQTRMVLQHNEERFRLALELNAIGLWTWHVASEFMTWDANHFRLLGFRPGEVVPTYRVWCDRIHPKDVAQVEQKIAQALTTQTDYEAEYRVIWPDGSMRWLLGKGRGVYNEKGQPVRMTGVLLDINDHKQIEEQQAFQVSLLNQVQNAVIATDLEGRITYWNQFAQQLYQLVPADMGRSILEVTIPVAQREIATQMMATVRATGSGEGKYEVQRPDGSCFMAYMSYSIIQDQIGNPCGMVGISINISTSMYMEA